MKVTATEYRKREMLWPFTKRSVSYDTAELQITLPIGGYCVGDTVGHLESLLIRLSPAELIALNSKIQFVGEEIWHAPAAHFMSLEWDTILATVDRTIYKIAAQWTGPRAQAGKVHRELIVFCTKSYRQYKNQPVWDTRDGNVVIHSVNLGAQSSLNVFLTSHSVREFQRL
jgi:hypothetical protein